MHFINLFILVGAVKSELYFSVGFCQFFFIISNPSSTYPRMLTPSNVLSFFYPFGKHYGNDFDLVTVFLFSLRLYSESICLFAELFSCILLGQGNTYILFSQEQVKWFHSVWNNKRRTKINKKMKADLEHKCFRNMYMAKKYMAFWNAWLNVVLLNNWKCSNWTFNQEKNVCKYRKREKFRYSENQSIKVKLENAAIAQLILSTRRYFKRFYSNLHRNLVWNPNSWNFPFLLHFHSSSHKMRTQRTN